MTETSRWGPPALGSPLRLILVRHGETTLTAARRYSGRGEVRLSERGAAQAQAAAARIAGMADARDVVVIASPLTRCVQTAAAIATATRAEVTIDPDLVECDFGAWEGLTFSEVTERYPEEHAAWLASTAVAPPGGESFQAVAERARRCVDRVRGERQGQFVVAVSHVSPIKLVLRDALEATDAFLFRCFLSPAGISIVDFYADGGIAVRSINDTAHLDGAQPRARQSSSAPTTPA